MAITDPQAIRFVNEVVRPLAEAMRGTKYRCDDVATTWFAGMNAFFIGHEAEPVEDGREGEGVSRLTGADVVNLVSQAFTYPQQVNTEIVTKPCVRPLSAS